MYTKVNQYDQYLRSEQDELALKYLPAVRAMAYRLKERLPGSVDMNDLVSIGTEELIKLSRRYDSNKNDSFWGYARKRVNGSMLDYLRTLDVLSRSSRKLVKAVDYEISKYFNEHEEEPTNEYLSMVLNEDIDRIRHARFASDIYLVIPMDDQHDTNEADDIQKQCEHNELMRLVQDVLKELPQREQLIIQLYYLEELSLSEISEVMNITESRVSQIAKDVLRKIRRSLGDING